MKRWIWKIRKRNGVWLVWRTDGYSNTRPIARHTWQGALAVTEQENGWKRLGL